MGRKKLQVRSKWAIRKQSQKIFPIKGKVCERCGGSYRIQRHHPDYTRDDLVEILCQTCHVKADEECGYRRVKGMVKCVVCGSDFVYPQSKKQKTCSRECFKKLQSENTKKQYAALKS